MNPAPTHGQKQPASTGGNNRGRTLRWLLAGAALLGLCLGIIAVAIPLAALVPGLFPREAEPTTLPIDRRLVADSLGLRESWSLGEIHLPIDVVPCVVAADAGVAFVDFGPSATEGELTVVDGATGDMRWSSAGHSTLFSLGTDGTHVFVASNGKIQSYNLSDGELIWESVRLPAHADYLVAPGIGAYLDVLTSSDNLGGRQEIIRRFDAERGLPLSQEVIDVPGQAALLIRTVDHDFWADGAVVRAIERGTGRVAWETTVPGTVRMWPVLTGHLLILRAGSPGPVVALNQSTGATEWLYDTPIVSNLVLRDRQVLALQSSGDLTALDVSSGKPAGEASFSLVARTLLSTDFAYCLAMSTDRVFVYFGDGAQLIALEWIGAD